MKWDELSGMIELENLSFVDKDLWLIVFPLTAEIDNAIVLKSQS